MKAWIYEVHKVLGLSLGLVLVVMGIAGAMYAFEREIRLWMGEEIVSGGLEARLGADELAVRMAAQGVGGEPTFFLWDGGDRTPVWVDVSGGEGGELWPVELMVDPYTGEILPRHTALKGFFDQVLEVHISLGMGDSGRWLTGLATVSLGLLVLTGLIYSLPRLRRMKEMFLVRDPGRRPVKWGRWHRALGWWLTPVLLLSVVTGLVWSFSGYLSFLYWVTRSEKPPPPPRVMKSGVEVGELATLEQIWVAVAPFAADARAMRLAVPGAADVPVRFEWQPPISPFTSARSTAWVHPVTAELLRVDRVEDYSLGTWLYRSAYPLHTGIAFGWPGKLLMAMGGLSLPFFYFTGLWLFFRHRAKRRQAVASPASA